MHSTTCHEGTKQMRYVFSLLVPPSPYEMTIKVSQNQIKSIYFGVETTLVCNLAKNKIL